MAKRNYQVRVLAGDLKGRMLKYPRDPAVRPTMQRTKESVFESLSADLKGAIFIDLYAGAGGIGIEALSRGAARVHFVEHGRAALDCLRDNLSRCRIDDSRYRVHATDVIDFLRASRSRDIRPNVVYVDPPYHSAGVPVLLEFLSRIDYPAGGMLVLEHPKDAAHAPERLVRTRLRRFGQTSVSFFVPPQGDV